MSRFSVLAALSWLALATPAIAKDTYVYGPKPDWTRYKELGEAAVRARLADPKIRSRLAAVDNWSIEWPNGYMEGGWRHKGRFPGYLSCGRLRAASLVGDRYPVVNFVVVIDHDAAKTVDISGRESNSLVNVMCEALVQKGMLPPAKLMDVSPDLSVTALGLTIRSMPEGAYIVAAVAGGPGERAGLAPGMVITRVNGIVLGGIGPAMARVLESDVPRLDLDTATGRRLIVERAR